MDVYAIPFVLKGSVRVFRKDKNGNEIELIINKIKPENIIKLAIVLAGKEPYVTKLPK